MSKTTYGESMKNFEDEQDYRYWLWQFERATTNPEYNYQIEELVQEGIEAEYDIPLDTSDKQILHAIRCAMVAAQTSTHR